MFRYLLALLLFLPAYAGAAEMGKCDGVPEGAVVELPSPLDQWGKVECKTNGYVITNHEGWYWAYPRGYAEVTIPSQMVKSDPKPLGNKSYFTKITIEQMQGEAAEKATAILENEFDKSPNPPKVYAVHATSVSGMELIFDVFQYSKHHWGMWCTNECDPNSKFMILDLNE